ncbi:MAG TPA: PorV/PorQ family protein, partial [Phaeodactylibacter sp.]|nr:PorV/PorQ family protein [Phaeodactylibacter sp.]
LLMNPWARSAGLHSMSTAFVSGVDALRINVAGLARVNSGQINIGHTRYLEGTDVSFNAIGVAQRINKNGVLGISIMAIDVGDILVTTVNNPEPTSADITFSPTLFNMGLSYAHMFENKVTVGVTFRFVSESTDLVSASSFALDAGVQYVTGPQDNFKIGIALRNVGAPVKYRGEGLTQSVESPNTSAAYNLTYSLRAQKFELPSLLNIGLSYDFIVNPKNKVTLLGNFTANSFSQDQIGAGLEYAFNDRFVLRGGYKYEFGSTSEGGSKAPVYTGLAAGFSIQVPLKKESKKKFAIDYAYRHTKLWNGSHSIGIRFDM